MAIAFDNSAYLTDPGTSTQPTLTQSYTTSGSNICLLVGIGCSSASTDRVTGVTYNGVSMTRVNFAAPTATVGSMAVYALFGAASGAHNIVASTSSGTNTNIWGAASSYNGVPSTVADNSTNATATSVNHLDLTLTPVADNCWIVGFWDNGSTSFSSFTNATQRVNNGSSAVGCADTNGVIHPAGSTTITGNNGTTGYVGVAVSISPTAPAAPANGKFLTFM